MSPCTAVDYLPSGRGMLGIMGANEPPDRWFRGSNFRQEIGRIIDVLGRNDLERRHDICVRLAQWRAQASTTNGLWYKP